MTALAGGDPGSGRILLIVPDDSSGRPMGALLQRHGYEVLALPPGGDALVALRDRAVDLVVMEASASDDEGQAALSAIRGQRRYADMPVLVLGGVAPGRATPIALLPGAADIVPEPVEPVDLLDRVRASLRTSRSLLAMEEAHAVVASLATELIAPETDIRLHTERLGTYGVELARRAGLSAADLHAVAYATLLHDLGRLGIDESILLKPGPLSTEETAIMRRHSEVGERLAARLVGAERFGPILRHHHERWDGRGYPDGLRGEAIPMGARIIGVVDAFDAMTQDRVYRSAVSVPQAVEELRRERGGQFDPELVYAFIAVLEWDGLI